MSGPASFTPSTVVDPSKERDWPAQLGMLDWDTTNIVFTKRSLLEFLKYAGVTVDTNFTNIQKLPRYVQFGKFASNSTPELEPALTDAASAPSASSTAASDFKPTRRVREVPGGATHDIFGSSADDDALSRAPTGHMHPPLPLRLPAENEGATPPAQQRKKSNNSSGISSLWDAPDESEAFKPTRRVREMPGGKDSISGLF
ncbi:hypothetical protein LXA43DRAFT_1097269 [Ganoderma leucocontextum]|nr:hypothetical protein LXA43DRAFT_1097269 [Ganoderma leucocontextum]